MDDQAGTVTRKYIEFHNVARLLHQNVSKSMEVKQFYFEHATVLEYTNTSSRSDRWGSGWVCMTIVQDMDLHAQRPSPGQSGFMCVDVAVDNEPKENMFTKGTVAAEKALISAAGTHTHDGDVYVSTLMSIVFDPHRIKITRVDHTSRSHPRFRSPQTQHQHPPELQPCASTSSGDERRPEERKSSSKEKSYDDERRRKDCPNGMFVPKDPRVASKPKERRRPDDESRYRAVSR